MTPAALLSGAIGVWSGNRRICYDRHARSPFLTNRIGDAAVYAGCLHRNQISKGSGISCVPHLLAVTALPLENGAGRDQAIAALLHHGVQD